MNYMIYTNLKTNLDKGICDKLDPLKCREVWNDGPLEDLFFTILDDSVLFQIEKVSSIERKNRRPVCS